MFYRKTMPLPDALDFSIIFSISAEERDQSIFYIHIFRVEFFRSRSYLSSHNAAYLSVVSPSLSTER